ADTSSGFEARDIVRLNWTMLHELEGGLAPETAPALVRRGARLLLPSTLRTRIKQTFQPLSRFRFIRWDQVESVARKHREEILDTAKAYSVAKDTVFCLTLPVWIAAGAPIEHVVVCVRNLDATMDSWSQAGIRAARTR